MVYSFFLEYIGDLCIVALRKKIKRLYYTPPNSVYVMLATCLTIFYKCCNFCAIFEYLVDVL
jgi:hypothetical protein